MFGPRGNIGIKRMGKFDEKQLNFAPCGKIQEVGECLKTIIFVLLPLHTCVSYMQYSLFFKNDKAMIRSMILAIMAVLTGIVGTTFF